MAQSFNSNISSFSTNSSSFSNNVTFNNTNCFNAAVNFTLTDHRSNILAWLSPLDPRLRHLDIWDRRVEQVGEWLLQTEEFRSWRAGDGGSKSDDAILFCYGDPGVGKTFISSLVMDCLCDQARGQNVAVACFYFDFAAQKEQSPTSIMGAILKQVVSQLEEVPEELVQAYEDQKKIIGGRGPQLGDIVKMLQSTTSRKPTFICIDALDECVPGYRVRILDAFNQILQRSPGTRIFITGRPYIWAEVVRRLSGRVATIRITPQMDDIIGFLRTRLLEDTTPDAMDSRLEGDILKKIPEGISEIFLLVSLSVDAILQEPTISHRRRKLNAMTGGLGFEGAYGGALSQIKEQGGEKSRLGMAALMWISHSERPLKVDELRHALGVEIGSQYHDLDYVPSIGTLLSCCQGFVSVDKEASTVRLIHFTLQEYLRTHPEFFGRAHSTIAETCLSYLNSHQVKALSTTPYPDLRGTPFLEYSSLYWGVHAKRELSECARLLALKLFDDYGNHISTKILLSAEKSRSLYVSPDDISLFSSLHCASFFGIVKIVAILVEAEGCDVNQRDCTGSTPLMWAALNGHEQVVKLLLGRDEVNSDKPDMSGGTPLWYAAESGHERVIEMLLGQDEVGPDRPNEDGRTPLWCAAVRGHEGVAKLLLEQDDVNPDKPDKYGRAPLWYAADNGHEGVVKILLERDDVDPDKPAEYGHSQLRYSARYGHAGAVKIQLGRNHLSSARPSNGGETPLWRAALKGHEGVVKILLGRDDVNPDKPDICGRTPLVCAAVGGHEGVAKILLRRDDVNPNKPDNYGRTPLRCAAENGHEGIVKMLLGRDDVNPNFPNQGGRTPLWCAALNGHHGVVKILLGRDDVNPNIPNEDGRTPLWCAAVRGHEGVAKLLLERDDVNPEKPDKHGRAPLWYAAERGHAGVRALLQLQNI